jgi:hypothetical protein
MIATLTHSRRLQAAFRGRLRRLRSSLSLFTPLFLFPVIAFAQSPFDTGFTAMQTLFTGTVAKMASLIAIVVGGYPEPEFASFPVLLPMDAPLIRAYPRKAAIAEKFNAMVVLDIRNSRMKDFYDIWFMANAWAFDLAALRTANLFAGIYIRGKTHAGRPRESGEAGRAQGCDRRRHGGRS